MSFNCFWIDGELLEIVCLMLSGFRLNINCLNSLQFDSSAFQQRFLITMASGELWGFKIRSFVVAYYEFVLILNFEKQCLSLAAPIVGPYCDFFLRSHMYLEYQIQLFVWGIDLAILFCQEHCHTDSYSPWKLASYVLLWSLSNIDTMTLLIRCYNCGCPGLVHDHLQPIPK